MRVIGKTIQQRKARVNCDSLLSFNGVDQYADAGVQQNLLNAINYDKNWSGSLCFETTYQTSFRYIFSLHDNKSTPYGMYLYTVGDDLTVAFGNSQTTRKTVKTKIPLDSLINALINYNASTQTFEVFINGVYSSLSLLTNDTITGDVYTQTPRFLIAKAENAFGTTSYTKANLNHVAFFNRTLTEPEIKSIHRYGGLLPTSTHAACVAHYVADREGSVMWDVVEQYNWAKSAASLPTLIAYHATLQNFTPAQTDTEAGTNSAYLDFYEKTILKPFVDTDQDGTPDQPLIEKSSLLPPPVNALKFDADSNQYASAGNLGNIIGVRLAVKLEAVDQSIFTLDNTPASEVSVVSGSLVTGSSIVNAILYVDGFEVAPTTAGDTLNDLRLHDMVILFDSVIASDFRITIGDKKIAAWAIITQRPTKTEIIELANNTLLANPSLNTQDKLSDLYDLNQIIDNSGTYELTNHSGGPPQRTNATLSGFTPANLAPNDPLYSLQKINDLR